MITSTSNEKVKNLARLVKKSRERRNQGVFIVEGSKMFEEAPVEWIREVYISESAEKDLQGDRYKQFPYEILADRVFQTVSDTQTPQGILCVLCMPQWNLDDIYGASDCACLFLEDIQDPGNLGTMIRTGEGAGISGIIVSRQTVDLYNPKTIRATMGSIYRVPVIVAEDFHQEIQNAQQAGMKIYAAHLKGSGSYDEETYTGRTGFLIGNEGNGLQEATADLADQYIRIPMEGRVESLNAAIAATILMYEMNRQRRRK